jgi:hypothetical protein
MINAIPAPMRFYNSSFASQFHTYKIVRLRFRFAVRALLRELTAVAGRMSQVWTTNSVAWMVDTGAALRVRLPALCVRLHCALTGGAPGSQWCIATSATPPGAR